MHPIFKGSNPSVSPRRVKKPETVSLMTKISPSIVREKFSRSEMKRFYFRSSSKDGIFCTTAMKEGKENIRNYHLQWYERR